MNNDLMVFDVKPMAAPRMNKNSAWKFTNYWAYKDTLKLQANIKGFTLPESIKVTFVMPLYKSYSKKKKRKLSLQPHQRTPDNDNLQKGLLDCLASQDNYVHDIHVNKIWADFNDEYEGMRGCIIVRRTYKDEQIGTTLYDLIKR